MLNLDRLQTWLNQSDLQRTNISAFQVISHLIRAVRELQDATTIAIAANTSAITGFENLDFLTHSNEAGTLPNSRQLIAGTNITFDDTIVNERTINATGGSGADGYWTPLTDGDPDETELIFAAGECIAVFVPTP